MYSLYPLARPVLLRMDAETAHGLTLKALQYGLVPPVAAVNDPALQVRLWDRKFRNPVGLAAGFDKNAAVIGPLFGMGFGFVEAGTVTPLPQNGNPRPRVFRHVASGSVINAMGFPNLGAETFRANIEKFFEQRPRTAGIVGINIGMNKGQDDPVKDYRALVRQLGPLADYLTVNISSPNTPGLRNLQSRENLVPLLAGIMEERAKSCGSNPPPLLVKLSPDIDQAQEADIARALLDSGVDGLILTNTTLDRPDSLPPEFIENRGGLSGALLREKSIAALGRFYGLTGGKLPLIGAGGIGSAQDAWDRICAGASLVQLYTALVFKGPDVVNQINTGLLDLMKQAGVRHISNAVGSKHGKHC